MKGNDGELCSKLLPGQRLCHSKSKGASQGMRRPKFVTGAGSDKHKNMKTFQISFCSAALGSLYLNWPLQAGHVSQAHGDSEKS